MKKKIILPILILVLGLLFAKFEVKAQAPICVEPHNLPVDKCKINNGGCWECDGEIIYCPKCDVIRFENGCWQCDDRILWCPGVNDYIPYFKNLYLLPSPIFVNTSTKYLGVYTINPLMPLDIVAPNSSFRLNWPNVLSHLISLSTSSIHFKNNDNEDALIVQQEAIARTPSFSSKWLRLLPSNNVGSCAEGTLYWKQGDDLYCCSGGVWKKCKEISGAGQYQREINITNNTNLPLTNYQVKVTLDTKSLIEANKMRNDCGDIRFSDTANQELSYWIEYPGCGTSQTNIWVKVPNIPPNSSTTIYMTYGNKNLPPQSNGSTTFDYFTTWQNDLDGWTILNGGGSGNGGREILSDNQTYLRLTAGACNTQRVVAVKNQPITFGNQVGWIMETRFRTDNNPDPDNNDPNKVKGFVIGVYDPSNPWCNPPCLPGNDVVGGPYFVVARQIPYKHELWWDADPSRAIQVDASSDPFKVKNSYIIGYSWFGGRKGFVNRSEKIVDNIHNFTGLQTPQIYLGVGCGTKYFDWFLIRKYVEPEPSVVVSSEISL